MPEGEGGTTQNVVTVGEDGFIPGTTYKSVDELLKGHQALKEKFDSQGNELGEVRKAHEGLKSQAETLATVLKEQLNKGTIAEPTKTIDYGAELVNIEKQIQELDPMAADYQRTLASLVAKSNKISALDQHEKTLSAAGELMRKELTERDVKLAQETFYRENPTFNTPEMQAKIREYIARDKTGMSDPLSAFREIQRDEIAAEAKRLAEENAEFKRLIDLNKGKTEAGTVVVKTQGSGQQTETKSKVTGKDLDMGMLSILKSMNPT